MATWHEVMYRQEWVPLGVFWSLDWDSPDDTLEATVTAREWRSFFWNSFLFDPSWYIGIVLLC